MDVSGFTWVTAAAVLTCIIVLLAVCLDCRNKGPLLSIRQANASDEYMPSTEFRLIHPSQPPADMNAVHPASNLLSPYSPSVDLGPQRHHHSFTPTETESNPSYENAADGCDYPNDSDVEDTGYIIVLADPPTAEHPSANQSRASSPSSDQEYVNVPNKPVVVVCAEERDYLNVEPLQLQRPELTPEPSPKRPAQSDSDSAPSDSDSGDEGNYVNQPVMIHRQPSA